MAYFEVNKKPRLTFPTLTGSIVTFNSQYAGLPLKSHKIALTATQSGSGTPSPDNVRPISGADSIHIQNTCGINQWNEQWRNGYYSGTNGAYNPQNNTVCSLGRFKCTPNTSYYIYSGSLNINVMFYDENDSFLSYYYHANEKVITTPNNCYWLRWTADFGSGNTYNNDISINYPSTDTSYHAFVGQSATIQIGSTVYGGEYDARTGLFVAKGRYWQPTAVSAQGTQGGNIFYRINIPSTYYGINTPTGFLLCNEFKPAGSTHNLGECIITSVGSSFHITPLDQSLDTIDKMNAWLNEHPLEVVYELATPQTIQLPPCPIDTLLGENNIWSDTGNTTLQYPKFG